MAAEDYIGCWDQEDDGCYFLRDFTITEHTEKAVKIKCGDVEEWVPKSAIIFMGPPGVRSIEDITWMQVSHWIVYKKSLPFKLEHP